MLKQTSAPKKCVVRALSKTFVAVVAVFAGAAIRTCADYLKVPPMLFLLLKELKRERRLNC